MVIGVPPEELEKRKRDDLVRGLVEKAFSNGSTGKITIESGGIVRRSGFLSSLILGPEYMGVLLERDGSKLQINHEKYSASAAMYSVLYRELNSDKNLEIVLFGSRYDVGTLIKGQLSQ